MFITRIEDGKNKKYRIYSEEGYLFSLYGKEIKRYHLAENKEIPDCIISSIMDELIYKRGKERALFLIERRPLTEFMLREKLKSNEYPDDIIDRVVAFLFRYHYLDDMEYIRMFVNSYSHKKSRKQIQYDLQKKGIQKQDIEQYFLQYPYSDEDSLQQLFQRYIRNKNLEQPKDRQKVFRYFYSKGYASSLIQSEIQKYEGNTYDI